jgi:hypothetical protein
MVAALARHWAHAALPQIEGANVRLKSDCVAKLGCIFEWGSSASVVTVRIWLCRRERCGGDAWDTDA